MIRDYNVELIAIGNGTASRETEQFVAQVIQEYHYQFNLLSSMKQVHLYILLLK